MFVQIRHHSLVDTPLPEAASLSTSRANACAHFDRIGSNLSRQQAYRFRVWTFAVGIFADAAFLFRYDRSGCQVSERIDYSTELGNRQLTAFFLRLDRMADDPEARGWDPTVSDPSKQEIKCFSDLVKSVCEGKPESERMVTRGKKKKTESGPGTNPFFRRLVQGVGDPDGYPRKKLSVMDGEVSRDYIVGRPTTIPEATIGRSTRAFVAMSVETKKLVLLKDTWRINSTDIISEDHCYKRLVSKKSRSGVKNIGAYLHGSDVYARKQIVRCSDMKQRTIAHHYARDFGQKRTIDYIHYRMIQPELYISVYTFKDSKHLTSIMLGIARGGFFSFT